MTETTDFRTPLVALFREVFEGKHGPDWTVFAQGGEGVFNTLDEVTAEQASIKPSPDCASIFAHLNHAHFYLSLFLRNQEDFSWAKTWEKQTCTDAEWKELAANMRRDYEEARQKLESGDLSGEDMVMYAIAQLAHVSFHLGAVRSLVRIVS